jgi:hypothetical protein
MLAPLFDCSVQQSYPDDAKFKRSREFSLRAFSSEVDTGSRQENASNIETELPFRFNRNGRGSGKQERIGWLRFVRLFRHQKRQVSMSPGEGIADHPEGIQDDGDGETDESRPAKHI